MYKQNHDTDWSKVLNLKFAEFIFTHFGFIKNRVLIESVANVLSKIDFVFLDFMMKF